MLDPLKPLVNRVCFRSSGNCTIGNLVFNFHYKVTTSILISFAVMLTTYAAFGKSVYCLAVKPAVSEEALNQYCWTLGTHLSNESERNLNYYQWVWLIFVIQALAFYLPGYLWKMAEANLVQTLCTPEKALILDLEEQSKYVSLLRKCFFRKYHRRYLTKFVFCELLNLCNVLIQFCFVEHFTEGRMYEQGLDIISFLFSNFIHRSDWLTTIFPVTATCEYRDIGVSGSRQTLDTLCILPLNAYYEKMFVFMWCWFAVLSILSFLGIIYRFFTLCSQTVRCIILQSKLPFVNGKFVRLLSKSLDIGDWFMLIQISKNFRYPLLVDELVLKLTEKVLEE